MACVCMYVLRMLSPFACMHMHLFKGRLSHVPRFSKLTWVLGRDDARIACMPRFRLRLVIAHAVVQ